MQTLTSFADDAVVVTCRPAMDTNMPMAPTQDHADFISAFLDEIRCVFDWSRFLTDAWPITKIRLTHPKEWSRLYLPWYIGKDGPVANYKDEDARPMNLAEMPNLFDTLTPATRAGIQFYIDQFKSSEHVTFDAPTYGLPDDQFSIMDRCHRLAALTMVDRPFAFTVWNVGAP